VSDDRDGAWINREAVVIECAFCQAGSLYHEGN